MNIQLQNFWNKVLFGLRSDQRDKLTPKDILQSHRLVLRILDFSLRNYIPIWHRRIERFYWNEHARGQRGAHLCYKNRKQRHFDVPISIFNHKSFKKLESPKVDHIKSSNIGFNPTFSFTLFHPFVSAILLIRLMNTSPFNFLDTDKKVSSSQSLMAN